MTPSMQSHSSTWLPSMSSTGSPLPTPRSRSQRPTRSERAAIASKVIRSVEPSSATTTRASASLPRAIASNQSTAQQNRSPTSGHANRSTASSCRPRRESSRSRASRYRSVALITPLWHRRSGGHGMPCAGLRLVAAAERGVGERLGARRRRRPGRAAARGRAPRRGCGRRRSSTAPGRRSSTDAGPWAASDRDERRLDRADPSASARAGSGASARPSRCARTAPTAVSGSSRPRQAPSGRESSVPANRWPPRCGALPDLVGQRPGEGGDDRAAAHGAAGVAGAVGADEHHGRASSSLPLSCEPRAWAAATRSSDGAPGPAHLRAAHGVDGVPGLRLVAGLAPARASHEQHLARRTTRRSARPRRRPAPSSGGVSIGFFAHGPWCSMSSHREATGALPACGSARCRDAAEQRERSVRATPRCYAGRATLAASPRSDAGERPAPP